MSKSKIIEVEGREIAIISDRLDDFISLTDIAKHKNEEATGLVISHWLSTRYTVEFMGLWAYGSKFIIPILMLLNSVTLKAKRGVMAMFYRQSNGLTKQMQLALYQKRADITAVLLPIGILRLNLLPGYLQVLSYT